jgi:hypothetical protein
MPYIDENSRKRLLFEAEGIAKLGMNCQNAGELNYTITRIIYSYYKSKGGRYQIANDIMGALEGAKLEFYRKVIGKYEDLKAQDNGEVYE